MGQRVGGQIAKMWFVRVAFSSPCLALRALATFCRDFPLVEQAVISHEYVARVRDAFAEILKMLNRRELAAAVARRPEASFLLSHIHDEAAMRIRSYTESPQDECELPRSAPRCARGRSSKVQNNALRAYVGTDTFETFVELQALMHKDANTVAHALRQVAEYVIAAAVPSRRVGHRLRFLHLITGDGVPTNMAACRRVWQAMRDDDRVDYRLIVWLCVAHQVNLVVQVAICGQLLQDPINSNAVCGACVRLFKYLVKDYFEEYAASLRAYVVDALAVVAPDITASAAHRVFAGKLRNLYGDRAVPEALMRFYMLGFDRPMIESALPETLDVRKLRGELFVELRSRILQVEEHPIVTRFWLLGECVQTLLLISLFNIPTTVFTVNTVKPQEKQQGRIAVVQTFWGMPQTPSDLRKAAVCLRVTSYCLNLVSQKRQGPGQVLVSLARGQVQQKTGRLVSELLRGLLDDPQLAAGSTLVALLATFGQLLLRLRQYQQYPTKLWALSKDLNSAGWAEACLEFVHVDVKELDGGYSYLLQREAWRCGHEAGAVTYLMSAAVQQELAQLFKHGQGTSLDAERKIAQDKKN